MSAGSEPEAPASQLQSGDAPETFMTYLFVVESIGLPLRAWTAPR